MLRGDQHQRLVGGGGAAPAIAAPAMGTVRPVGGAPSGGSGGARPSPVKAKSEVSTQHKRGLPSSSAPAAAGITEQRRKRGESDLSHQKTPVKTEARC